MGHREDVFDDEGGETLEEVAQRHCGCLVIGSVQGQARQVFEQADRVRDVPAHGRGIGLDGLSRSLPTQTIL